FVSNNEPNIGHFDAALSTADSLFLADITSGGDMGTGAGQGMIYQIHAINGQSPNQPPVLATIPDQAVDEGAKLTVATSASDPDPGQTITYSLGAGAPAGAVIDGSTGVFTWTPDPYASTGTYPITVVATDNGSPPLSDSQPFTIHVLAVNHPPNFEKIPGPIVEPTQPPPVKDQDYISDPAQPAQTLMYALAADAPAGASVDPSSGVFTWTPDSNLPVGVYSIGVVVSDNGSPPLSASETFAVNLVPFNHPP